MMYIVLIAILPFLEFAVILTLVATYQFFNMVSANTWKLLTPVFLVIEAYVIMMLITIIIILVTLNYGQL